MIFCIWHNIQKIQKVNVSFGFCPSASKFCLLETSTVTNFLSLSFKSFSADVSSSMHICVYMYIYTYKHTCKFITQMEAYWIYYFLHLEFSLDDIFW